MNYPVLIGIVIVMSCGIGLLIYGIHKATTSNIRYTQSGRAFIPDE